MVRLPQDQEDHILAVYREGHSRERTAEIVGCSPDTVTHVHRRRGVPMRPRGGPRYKISHEDYDVTRELYEAGYSEAEVGVILGRSRGAISWRLRYAGIPRRRPDHAKELQRQDRPHPQPIVARFGLQVVAFPQPPRRPGPVPEKSRLVG